MFAVKTTIVIVHSRFREWAGLYSCSWILCENKHKNAQKYNSDDNDICLRYLFYKSCHFGNKCKRKHLNPGDDEYNEVLQRLNSDSHQAPNETNATHEANVAFTTYPEDSDDSERDGTELRPELVGMDIFGIDPVFGLHGGSKN